MAKQLVDDALWQIVEPLLPPPARTSERRRPRLSDRAALTGIWFVLKSGIPWEMLPQEMGCGSGMTCRSSPPRLAPAPESGRSYTSRCCAGWSSETRLTGAVPASTQCVCAPQAHLVKRGCYGAEPDGSR